MRHVCRTRCTLLTTLPRESNRRTKPPPLHTSRLPRLRRLQIKTAEFGACTIAGTARSPEGYDEWALLSVMPATSSPPPERLPWGGFTGFVAALDIYDLIRRTTCRDDFLSHATLGVTRQHKSILCLRDRREAVSPSFGRETAYGRKRSVLKKGRQRTIRHLHQTL
jgi:hypothetical protein